MQVVTCQKMRKLLQRDINFRRFSDDDLILSAALSMQQIVRQDCPNKILIVCGNFENGNYGLSLGSLLKMDGFDVKVVHNNLSETRFSEIYKKLQIEVISSERNIRHHIEEATYIIDCLYGIELDSRISYPYSYWIDWINNSKAYVLSCDLPSGVNGDDGSIFGCCVRANKTVCLQLPKLGLYLYPANQYSGEIVIESIGLSIDALNDNDEACFIHDDEDIKKMLPKRVKHSHKGSYGKVLLIAGSTGKIGAAILCGKALLKSGCGLLTILSYEKVVDKVNASLFEAMTIGFNEDNFQEVVSQVDFENYDLIVCGPGLSRNKITEYLVEKVLKTNKSVVLDADGLFYLNEKLDLLKRDALTVLTPHFGEYQRIYPFQQSTIIEDLTNITLENPHLAICLKSENTLIAYQGIVHINNTGNDALAKGGSGDVLAGVIGGLLAQVNDIREVIAAVYIHSKAADIFVSNHSHYSLLASELIELIDKVLYDFTKE